MDSVLYLSSTAGHPDWLHISLIMNGAAMNVDVQDSLWYATENLLDEHPRNAVRSRSQDNWSPSSLHQLMFPWLVLYFSSSSASSSTFVVVDSTWGWGWGVQVRVNCRCRSSGIITLFSETGTLSNLGNTNSAKRASQKVPGTQSAPPSGAGITSACHHFWLALHGFLEGQTPVLELYAQTLCWASLLLSPSFLTIAILAELRGNQKSL